MAKDFIMAERYRCMAEAEQIASVRRHPTQIRHIKNPSEAVQLAAVASAPHCAGYIENPTEAVQWAIIHASPVGLQHIKNPSEAVQIAALQQAGWLIEVIKDPSEAVQLVAAEQGHFEFIKNPAPAVQQAYDLTVKALRVDPGIPGFSEAFRATYEGIKNPTKISQVDALPGLENLDFKPPSPSYEF